MLQSKESSFQKFASKINQFMNLYNLLEDVAVIWNVQHGRNQQPPGPEDVNVNKQNK